MKTTAAYLLLFLSLPAMRAMAQTDAQMSASLTVLPVLSVVTENNLDFGQVIREIPKTIQPHESMSARIRIDKSTDLPVDVRVAYPESLTFGNHAIALKSDTRSARISGSATRQEIFFDPARSELHQILPNDPRLSLQIGGTVHATGNVPGGSYQGVITVHVRYSGL